MSSTTQPVTKKRSIPDEAPQHLRRKSPIAPFSWTARAWTLKRRRWRRSNNQISWWLPSADGNIQIVHSCRCPWNLKFNWWFSLWQAMTSFFCLDTFVLFVLIQCHIFLYIYRFCDMSCFLIYGLHGSHFSRANESNVLVPWGFLRSKARNGSSWCIIPLNNINKNNPLFLQSPRKIVLNSTLGNRNWDEIRYI